MKFSRPNGPGVYFAYGAVYAYVVYRTHGGSWTLNIRRIVETAGVRHAVGQPVLYSDTCDTKRLAQAVAREFESLGEGFQSHEHGGGSRLTEAIQRAYAVPER